MAYGNFKDLPKWSIEDKILRGKAFNNQKNDKYQRGLALIVYKILDEKTSNTSKGTGINSGVVSRNKKPVEELHKPIIKKNWKTKTAFAFSRQYLGCLFCLNAIIK